MNIGGYRVKSNRESGKRQTDIVMQTVQIRKGRVIILELKIAGSIAEMEAACDRALAQIEAQHYAEPFITEGYPEVKKYALSFCKKRVHGKESRIAGINCEKRKKLKNRNCILKNQKPYIYPPFLG